MYTSSFVQQVQLKEDQESFGTRDHENDQVEIRVDTRMATDVKVSHNKPNILVLDKKKKKIIIVEIDITNQNLLSLVKYEKLRKYNLLANEQNLIQKTTTKSVPYLMTWDSMVTKLHKKYIPEFRIRPILEA